MKEFWKSKTIWVAVLSMGAVWFTEIASLLGSEGTISVMSVLMIALRLVTDGPVSLK